MGGEQTDLTRSRPSLSHTGTRPASLLFTSPVTSGLYSISPTLHPPQASSHSLDFTVMSGVKIGLNLQGWRYHNWSVQCEQCSNLPAPIAENREKMVLCNKPSFCIVLIDSCTLKLPKKYHVGGRLIFYEGLHLPDFCVSDTQTSYSNSSQLTAFYPLCE